VGNQLTIEQMAVAAADNVTPSDLFAAGWTLSDLRAAGWTLGGVHEAGWTLSGVRAAGWTPRGLRAAGWTPSDLREAGWTPSDLIAAGWTPRDVREAGLTLSDVEEFERIYDAIPKLDMPYTRLLNAIRSKTRIHNQSVFGPEEDPKTNLCGTPMCTAGHLVNMAGDEGYKLMHQFGFAIAAYIIAEKAHPGWPQQNYGSIPQEWALAFIQKAAESEAAEATQNE
jgi:hypothetical protein